MLRLIGVYFWIRINSLYMKINIDITKKHEFVKHIITIDIIDDVVLQKHENTP